MTPRKWNLTKNVQWLWEPADLWVGFFWDRVKRKLYFLPVPCLGLVFQFRSKTIDPQVRAAEKLYGTGGEIGYYSPLVWNDQRADVKGPADPTLFKDGLFPHCDPRVLHAPGECEICDEYAFAAQTVRIDKSINFTGHRDPLKQPCPADVARGIAGAHAWHGNRPSK